MATHIWHSKTSHI